MTGATLAQLAADLRSGRTTARALTLECLEAIENDPMGRIAYLEVDRDGALAQAEHIDQLRRAGTPPSAFAGIPIAIKDLFDVTGQVTRAGSVVLEGRQSALKDADAVAALRRAGLVLVGRSNMTEFAFSGLGMNPHYGTPISPWRRDEQHLAGGSTSGGAMAVALGMAHAALGTDTGGSCRIPAAWCGLVGFKPTAARVSRSGTVPLSVTLDSVGSLGRSVSCCATIDSLMSGGPPKLEWVDLRQLRLGMVTNVVLDGITHVVASIFDDALDRLRRAGCNIVEIRVEAFEEVAGLNAKGGFAAAEAYAWHRELLAERGDEYDPRVRQRISRGAAQSAADYIELLEGRSRLIAKAQGEIARFDAILMPTTPILPPRIVELAKDEEYGRVNLLALRNPTLINMIDGCAVSVPIAYEDEVPAGLMVAAARNTDRRLLAVAAAIEAVVADKAALRKLER